MQNNQQEKKQFSRNCLKHLKLVQKHKNVYRVFFLTFCSKVKYLSIILELKRGNDKKKEKGEENQYLAKGRRKIKYSKTGKER